MIRPPPLSTGDPGSFAHFTFTKRVPSILHGIFSSAPNSASATLRAMAEAPLDARVVTIDLPDDQRQLWASFFDDYAGKRIRELPFFDAEVYLYALILSETGAFVSGNDPFAAIKAREFAELQRDLERWTVRVLENDDESRLARIGRDLAAALRANSGDLSQLNPARATGGHDLRIVHNERAEDLVAALDGVAAAVYLVDNAYGDLWLDLLFVRTLLREFPSLQIRVLVKAHPIFVSDATLSDIEKLWAFIDAHLECMAMRTVAAELRKAQGSGALVVAAEPVLNAPLHFSSEHFLPALIGARFTIVKGDANYRRAVEDRAWRVDTQLSQACPSSLLPALFLRVLKSDCLCGLSLPIAIELDETVPGWRTNGTCGLAQLVYPETAALP